MAGAGYKLFNTGDVLTAAQVNTYLMEQTVMVFADAAARTAALSGVVSEGMISYLKDTNAVEVYNGSAWVASDDPNAIQNTIVDAKGDLITATAADVPARLAVGNNGETLVADSSASTGLRWQEPKAGNPVINSAFQIWQRGTSISLAASTPGYTADRWYLALGANQASTVSRQATGDTKNLPNIQYCARVQRNSGQTGTGEINFANNFESINSIPFSGKVVTLSFYARAGSNYSPTSSGLKATLVSGTGTDQNVIAAGYTGQNNFASETKTITTTWARYTISGTVPTSSTELSIVFGMTPTGTAGTNDYYEITGVQLEVGSVATPFKTQGVTLAGELAACQRYYCRWTVDGPYSRLSSDGYIATTTIAHLWNASPVTMRVAPTALEYSNVRVVDYSEVAFTPSAIVLTDSSKFLQNLQATISGATAGRGAFLSANNSTSAYVALSAEL